MIFENLRVQNLKRLMQVMSTALLLGFVAFSFFATAEGQIPLPVKKQIVKSSRVPLPVLKDKELNTSKRVKKTIQKQKRFKPVKFGKSYSCQSNRTWASQFYRQLTRYQTTRSIKLLKCSEYSASQYGKKYKSSMEVWKHFYKLRFGQEAVCNKPNSCARFVSKPALAAAFHKSWNLRREKFKTQQRMLIVDYSQHCSNKRAYLLNLKTGEASDYHVAHANAGEPWGQGVGRPVWFSNTSSSMLNPVGLMETTKSSVSPNFGSYRASGSYGSVLVKKYGRGLKLPVNWVEKIGGGYKPRLNVNPMSRAVYIHGHYEVSPKNVNGPWGCFSSAKISSLGCFVFPPKDNNKVIRKISGGSLVYVYGG